MAAKAFFFLSLPKKIAGFALHCIASYLRLCSGGAARIRLLRAFAALAAGGIPLVSQPAKPVFKTELVRYSFRIFRASSIPQNCA